MTCSRGQRSQPPINGTDPSLVFRSRMRRARAVARKEFVHVVRDWRSLFLAIAIPMVLILLFGYALTLDLRDVPTVVWDQSQTPQSREFLSFLHGSPYFSFTRYHDNYRYLQQSLDSGSAMIAVVIPADFADKIAAGDIVTVQVIADGSDANTARLALGYTRALAAIYSQQLRIERIRFTGIHPPVTPVNLVGRAWYNQDLRSQNVILPGILAVVMVVIAAMLTSVTVAREWEMGTMEQLISTPIRGPELVFGKVVPYFVIGMVDVALAVAMGKWLFGVPLRGNPGLVFATAAIFLSGALFFGLTLSIAMKSQVVANQLALVGSYLPTLLLSGFVFAIENMPLPLQIVTYIVPARYFITLLRSIYLKGIGLEVLWLNALLLTLYATVMIVVANKRMRLKLE